MKNLKSRIISVLIVMSMIVTGTAPKVFAEVFNESPVSEHLDSSLQNDGQTYSDGPVYITGELENLRTEYSKTYEQSDGSCVAVVSAEPVHFYDNEKELWKEYDNRLSYDEETETYESNENGSDMMVSLPKNIDEQNSVQVESDGYKVSIIPIDLKSYSSKKINDKKGIKSDKIKDLKKYDLEDYVSDSVLKGEVKYSQDDKINVEYVFSGSKLKENIILSTAPEKKQEYTFKIKSDGLTAKLNKDNSIKLLDINKKAVFTIPAPYMYDEGYEFSNNIKTTLKKNGSEYILTYIPDYKWLLDEERKYPIVIDPTITTELDYEKILHTSVISDTQYGSPYPGNLFVGAYSKRTYTMDTYICFTDLPKMENLWTILNAKLNLKTATNKDNKINAYKITSDWYPNSVQENQPSIDSKILDVCYVPDTADEWVYWDITNTVYDWYNGEENYGIKLSSPYSYNNISTFYSSYTDYFENIPYLSIEYKTISAIQLENCRTVDIGRAGTVTINDFSGNVVLSRDDIGVDGNVMPVNISMLYNLNDAISTPFGYGFKTNYSQTVKYATDIVNNKYFEYNCGDGTTVYFDYDEKTEEYIDRSKRGYSLRFQVDSTPGYSNIIITDSTNNEYYFDQYGRLIKIISTQVTAKPAINITYNGDDDKYFEIDYITDGVGRKYDFNYTDGKLTDILYYGKSSSVLKKVSYEYDSNSNLTKVIYPDGKSVSYDWNVNSLVSVYNVDGYHIDFEYNSYVNNVPKRVIGIKEYGSNGDYGADISVEYTPNQTKYINNNLWNTETLVFSSDGDLISTYNSEGQVTVNEYAKGKGAHGVSSLVNTYEHNTSEPNLLQNGEFETSIEGWKKLSQVPMYWNNNSHPGNNNGSIELSGEPGKGSAVYQEYIVDGVEGDSYDIGGWAKANASSRNYFGIWISFLNGRVRVGKENYIKFNPHCTDWQYAMKTVQAEGDYTSVSVSLDYSGQINSAYFDGIVMYTSSGALGEDFEEDSNGSFNSDQGNTESTTSIGEDGSVTTIEENDGVKTVTVDDKYGNNLSNATVVNGLTLSGSNEYSSDGNYQKSSTDSSGVKTSYTYDENTGNISSVNVNNNSVNYGYDTMGNITRVSQNVSGLSNGTAVENKYSYDSGDRLSRITHNGFNYDFGYTEFGLLKSIKTGSNSLINYGYDSEGFLTSANYGNSQTIDYQYNNDKNMETIYQDGNMLYIYCYDEYGTLNSVYDDVSNRVINYLTNDDGQDIIEETGDEFYHKLYSENGESVEVVGDKIKTSKTSSIEDYNATYLSVNDDMYLAYSNETDKFGRTSSKSFYNTYLDSEGYEYHNSDMYNKEYSYFSAGDGKTSDRVSKITYTGKYNKTIEYGYDGIGNISKVNDIAYVYDEAGQLTKEINETTKTGKEYVYDKGGNITEVRHLENGEYGKTDTYTYGDSEWKDLLTAYNGNEITYDEIGNPLTYYNGTEFQWTMGRRLKSAKRTDGLEMNYTYNVDGLRTSKSGAGIKYDYYWNGDKLTAQTWVGNTMYFYYDNDGDPIGFEFGGVMYYYVTNLQGDIIGILDQDGSLIAEYEYDAWGNCTITRDTYCLADENPFRYRGYYYDSDTGLYYLQSRYYDANIGRFINADDSSMLMENQDTIVQYNLFAYCGNNPVVNIDPTGYIKIGVLYYCNSKSSLSVQAHNSGYFKLYDKNVKAYAVRTVYEFVKFWNSIPNNLDYIYLYLHGDPGVLHFVDGTLGFNTGGKCSKTYSFKSLKSKKVKKGVILFSCYGGKGSYDNNVAWMFSEKIGRKPVVACTGGVSYYKLSGKYYARFSPKKFGSFYTFSFKKNIFGKWKPTKTFYGWFA